MIAGLCSNVLSAARPALCALPLPGLCGCAYAWVDVQASKEFTAKTYAMAPYLSYAIAQQGGS
eukprot:scaffold395804_cov20-Prasinocladus_malaysianus.AAC.1